jgi:leader peptidase (prepilin peptidase)/N-methyltransferase
MVILVGLCAVLGAACGAFAPRVADRLAVEAGRPPRPGCVHCGSSFPPGPSGWVRVGASCPTRRCGAAPRAALPVLAGGGAAGALGAALGPAPELFAFLAAAVLGLLLAMIDLACLRLPNVLVGALLAVISLPLTAGAVLLGEPDRLLRAVLAGTLCGAVHLLIPRLGLGDVKLAAVLGVLLGWLGWPTVLLGLLLPHLLTGPVALFLLLTRRAGRRTALPFGPALLTGALLATVLT